MTRTGRPRVPTATKKLEGTFRRDRANPDEPMPDILTGKEPPPDWLKTKAARTGWTEALPVLVEMGLATKADRIAIGMLCDAFGRWLTARDPIRRERAFDQLKGMLIEYGLTAQSRAKVHGAPKNKPTPAGAPVAPDAEDPSKPLSLGDLLEKRAKRVAGG